MRLHLESVSRRPAWPWWAILIVSMWACLVAVSVWVSQLTGRHVRLCLFKRITGVPCPTCGSTRSVLHLLGGDIAGAFRMQPFVFAAAVIFTAALLLRVLSARRVHVEMSTTARRIAWSLVLAAFLANWAYVILYVD